MAQIGTYTYDAILNFIDQNNEEINIPALSIVYMILDYDYDSLSMPILYISMNVNHDIYNRIVGQVEKAKFMLNLRKSDTSSSNSMYTDCIKDMFTYFVPTNPNYMKDIDKVGTENETPDQAYKRVTIGLLKMELVNYNKKITNGIFKNTTMLSLVHKCTSHMPMIIEPFTYNETIESVIVPPMATVSSTIEFLNNFQSFYDKGYRYFMDFDRTYLLSNSGEFIDAGDGSYGEISFSIENSDTVAAQQSGMIKDDDSRSYIIYTDGLSTDIKINRVTEKVINNIVGVTTDGDVIEQALTINNTDSEKRTIYKRIPNSNKNFINNLKSDIEALSVSICIEQSCLDASVFTPNRSYSIKNFQDYSSYNGKFILSQKKVFLYQNNASFGSMTYVWLRKV